MPKTPIAFLFAVVCVSCTPKTDSQAPPTMRAGRLLDARDGRTYRTLRIGNHVWMAQNLDFASDSSRCYGDDDRNCLTSGRMYTRSEARKVCPDGWRLPSAGAWKDLLREVGKDGKGFPSRSWTGTDSLDFGLVYGGQGNIGGTGGFEQVDLVAAYWSSSMLDRRRGFSMYMGRLGADTGVLARRDDDPGSWLHMRCVQDDSASPQAPLPEGNASTEAGMVRIPAGCFSMGTEEGGIEEFAHRVCLDSFEMDRTEVTNEAFSKAGGETHYTDNTCAVFDPGSRRFGPDVVPESFREGAKPVVCVDWAEADEYCRNVGKRLPTEAEYEYAARAGTTTDYFWGDDQDAGCRFANGTDRTEEPGMPGWTDWMECEDGWGFSTAPVGRFASNAWGLKDMSGNVREWVRDGYSPYDSLVATRVNPVGPESGNGERVSRGGAWDSPPRVLAVHARRKDAAQTRSFDLGFRCVSPRTPPPSSTRMDRPEAVPGLQRPSQMFLEDLIRNDDTLALGMLSSRQADTSFDQGIRPLHIATDIGSIASIRTLLRRGAPPNRFNGFAASPLGICITKERAECVEVLLEAGANPDTTSAREASGSALFRAVRTKNLRILDLLLASGARVDLRGSDGETALMQAACSGTPETIALLLQRGADLAARDEDGDDALHYAHVCRNDAGIAYLDGVMKSGR